MNAATPSGIHVLVVDDHPVVCRGLASLLGAETWIGRVSEAGTVREARRLVTTERPQVAIIDLGLPDGDGVELAGQLSVVAPFCATIVMTMTNDPDTVRAALAAGARGYLLKDSAPELVVAAVRTVAGGGSALGPGVATGPAPTGRSHRPAGPLDRLSPRERELLGLLAHGHTNREIAARLSLSEKTVRNLLSIITGKLGVADRVQAVLLARRHGLR
ncbi:hypothetical protein AWW66_17260 [Micromonospora rosaria]|uniref:LuxR family transcriptional regulator n=1 Tax=Micromonospora rosaria TaxID=47874 RepID=A0A136PQN1_9ACTN|nr:response regulator transcription factor [Micromonospora rosaria]KXK60752.1 hypothetical protein AWW66_17260 [Micromonospora rosaria]